jgi:hypothetical protein
MSRKVGGSGKTTAEETLETVKLIEQRLARQENQPGQVRIAK